MTIQQKREVLKAWFEWTDEYLDSLTEAQINHYYDIVRYGD